MRFADYTTNFDDLRARIVAENNFSRLISGKYTFVPVHKAYYIKFLDLFHDCVWFIEFQHPKSPVVNMTFPALMSPTMRFLITHFTEYIMLQCWSDNYKGNNI